MNGNVEQVFKGVENAEEVAEKIHELKKVGYQFLYSGRLKRLIIGQEWPYIEKNQESPYEAVMSKVSRVLGIESRQTYEEVDERYNLTMY